MIDVLPDPVRAAWLSLPETRRSSVTELRFRMDRPVTMVRAWGEEQLRYQQGPILVTDRLLGELYDRATGFSPYALKTEETGLFLPLRGGCRMGICGEVSLRDGKVLGIGHLSSASIRLAREHRGIGKIASDRLTESGTVESCLILSPPGYGKTSFLRDLVRCVSEKGFRVSLCDERRELSAMEKGKPNLDVGPCTDVLSGLHKTAAIPLMLRAMNPQVLAVDELSGEKELELLYEAASSGATVFATVHGGSLRMLMKKPRFRGILKEGLFDWSITIGRNYKITMERLERYAETIGCGSGGRSLYDHWNGGRQGAAKQHPPTAAVSACHGIDGERDGTEYAAIASAF